MIRGISVLVLIYVVILLAVLYMTFENIGLVDFYIYDINESDVYTTSFIFERSSAYIKHF